MNRTKHERPRAAPEETAPRGSAPRSTTVHRVLPRHDIPDFDDPYLPQRHLADGTVCRQCGAVYEAQRWTRDSAKTEMLIAVGTPEQAECPACRKIEMSDPQGIVTLRGNYWPRHRDEILHLISNEEERAAGKNPLERIMGIHEEEEGGCLVVWTTNGKLAQRIGRSIGHAHQGQVEYHWSEDNQLVRVDWERSLEA